LTVGAPATSRGSIWTRFPGLTQTPDVWLGFALFLTAAAVRVALAGLPPYGDEAAHYFVSRHLGQVPANVQPPADVTDWLFWQRPAFSLLLWPGAQFGFEGYRVWNGLLVALLPVLVFTLARQAGAGRSSAAVVGAIAVVHPSVVLWSVRVFPDALMASIVLCGLGLHLAGRRGAAALLLLVATWVKEPAALALAASVAHTAVQGWRAGRNRAWTLRLDKATSLGLYCLLVSPLPILVSILLLGGATPGWSSGPLQISHWDSFFLSVWLLVPILAALRSPRSIVLAAWAFLFPAFYFAYASLGHGVEAWYLVLPNALALAASAPGLTALARLLPTLGRPGPRWAATGLAVALCLAWTLAPGSTPGKPVVTPVVGAQASLAESIELAAADTSLRDAMRMAQATGREQLLAVDVGWFYIFYPLSESFDEVVWSYTFPDFGDQELEPWMGIGVVTFVQKDPKPQNAALLQRYASCTIWQDARHAVILADEC
jgi:hypothetical protein